MKQKKQKPIKPIPGYIVGIKSMMKGWRLTLDTQEDLKPEMVSSLAMLKDQYGWIVFLLDEVPPKLEDIDIPEGHVPRKEKESKSPSQRLRSVMFVYWKQQKMDEKGVDFNSFYEREIEGLITEWKKKLEDLPF